MNTYLSKKLRILSFIAIVMVVYWHSYNLNLVLKFLNIPGIEQSSLDLNKFLQELISHGIAAVSMPLFFAISGYLFFFKFKPSVESFISKYKKRAVTLLIPYLLWSAWGIILFFILQSIPFMSIFFNAEPVKSYSIGKLLYKFLWDPIPYQLWFIRDLIIYVIVSPLIYLLMSRLPIITLIILFSLWLFNVPLFIIDNSGIFFFIAGAYLALKNIDMLQESIKFKNILLPIWVIALLLTTSAFLYINANIITYIYRLDIVLGLVTIWFSYDIYIGDISENSKLLQLSFYTFFIYAAHEPLLIIVKKIMFKILGTTTSYANLIVYLVAPIATVILVLITGYYLKKIAPKFYNILTGGR